MKKNICVFTAGRSDYFILKPLLQKIKLSSACNLKLVAGSMHSREEFGNTYKLVESDGFYINYRLMSADKNEADNNSSALLSMSKDLEEYSRILPCINPDICIVLGDRYEVLAFAVACHILRLPIAHIHGGELSYGSFDDASRHAITKLAQLHFPATEEYRKRIVQMGEDPECVFNVGALAVENCINTGNISVENISQRLGIHLKKKYFLVTFHPETDVKIFDKNHIHILANALKKFPEYDIIWTISNADPKGLYINNILSGIDGIHLVSNLGDMYLSVMKKAAIVIGNSSSGIIEAPIIGVKTLNVGRRQDGRIRCQSIVDCSIDEKNVINSVNRILDAPCINLEHPYGCGNTSELVCRKILNYDYKKTKIFYNHRMCSSI